MKRPIGIYFVTVWCAIGWLIQVSYLSRLVKPYDETGQPPSFLVMALPLVVTAFLVWQVVGLVRLRAFPRWFCVGFLTWWTCVLTWNSIVGFSRPGTKPFGIVVAWAVIGGLNAASVWYLTRRSFRQFCAAYLKMKTSPPEVGAGK